MTPTNRTRECAAQLLSMAQCSNSPALLPAWRASGVRRDSPACGLAFRALGEALGNGAVTRLWYAEAEAMIRTGWLP